MIFIMDLLETIISGVKALEGGLSIKAIPPSNKIKNPLGKIFSSELLFVLRLNMTSDFFC